jgi:hypothetical protein
VLSISRQVRDAHGFSPTARVAHPVMLNLFDNLLVRGALMPGRPECSATQRCLRHLTHFPGLEQLKQLVCQVP